ncbi:MAG TPA: hypothetical protein VMR76_03595 [Candidatus Saccharimonadia bacterium]|nr:hypothetical protein [Candidatus Saccharimonadia bacterium]
MFNDTQDNTQGNTQNTTEVNGHNDSVDQTFSAPTTFPDPTQAQTIIKPTPSYLAQTSDPASPPPPSQDKDTDLLSIKNEALQKLAPLVSQLEQTPQEKFKTLMMLIRASDDDSLLKSAYECAQQIPDEKTKAQALLDVVNEINYFTHPQS